MEEYILLQTACLILSDQFSRYSTAVECLFPKSWKVKVNSGQSAYYYIDIHLLWDLCNWWLIHVKQIQSWHGPSLITCLVSHTTTYHIPSDIYYGPKGGNFEYQGFDGRNIENWTFLSYSLIDSRVRARRLSKSSNTGHFAGNNFIPKIKNA